MTKNKLLDDLAAFTRGALSEMLLPCAVREEADGATPVMRAVDVYKMRLPDSTSARQRVPYVIHQIVTAKDTDRKSTATVRSVFAVYSEDEQEGALILLCLMERLRIEMLKTVVIGSQFTLDTEAGLEMLVYAENTAPYFAGEMSSVWSCPAVKREVHL